MNKEEINPNMELSELEELRDTIQERISTLQKILKAIDNGQAANYEILNVMNKRQGKPNAVFFPEDEQLLKDTKDDIHRQDGEALKYNDELEWCERRLSSISRAIEQHRTSSFS